MFIIIPLIRDISFFSRWFRSNKTAISLVGSILGYTLRTIIFLVIVFTYERFNFHRGQLQKKMKDKVFQTNWKASFCVKLGKWYISSEIGLNHVFFYAHKISVRTNLSFLTNRSIMYLHTDKHAGPYLIHNYSYRIFHTQKIVKKLIRRIDFKSFSLDFIKAASGYNNMTLESKLLQNETY